MLESDICPKRPKQVQLCNIQFINVLFYSLNFDIRLDHFDKYQKSVFIVINLKSFGKVIKTVCKYCINTSKKDPKGNKRYHHATGWLLNKLLKPSKNLNVESIEFRENCFIGLVCGIKIVKVLASLLPVNLIFICKYFDNRDFEN